jgi:hypothetical protein
MSRSRVGTLTLTSLAVGMLGLLGTAVASVVTQMDLETLVRQSVVIVRGEVESVVSRTDGITINTYVTVRIDEGLKGAQGLARVTLKELGGRVGDQILVVPGVPEFQLGERVLIFAEPLKTGELTVIGLFQGKHRIELVNGVEVAVQGAAGEGAMTVGGSAAAAPARQLLSDLLDRVRQLVSQHSDSESLWQPAAPPVGEEVVIPRFTLEGSPPARWFEPDAGAAVTYLFNPTGAPTVVPGGARPAFVAALAAWTAVPGTSLKLADGGDTASQCLNPSGPDGVNSVSHNDPCDQMPSFNSASCSGVLGLGGFTSTFGQTTTINGVTFHKIVDGDVILNSGADCFWAGPGNYAEVVGHELGHSVGLGHSCGDASSPSCAGNPVLDDALMRAFIHGDGRGADPRADDQGAIHSVYQYLQAFLNQAAFTSGQTVHLTVSGNLTTASDAYVAVFLPGGPFFTFGPGLILSAPNTIIPFATAIPSIGSFTDIPVVTHLFSGTEAPGLYRFSVAFTPPGVSPLVAQLGMHSVSFTFTP